ncbi:MAG: IS1634 family transposase [Kineosporiaceae bacterium]
MVSRFVRRVRTASGAVAVQIVTRRGRAVERIEHLGSARTDAELALLLAAAQERLRPGQDALDLAEVPVVAPRLDDVADWTSKPGSSAGQTTLEDEPALARRRGRPTGVDAGGRVVETSSLVLWQVLTAAYARVGLDSVGDEAFRAMALARIVEPTSKADTLRVLAELGAPCPSLRTVWRSLKRCQTADYRDTVAKACTAFSAAAGGLATLVMYDCTTLHYEVADEDTGPNALRKVGMSKEHRVDPQVQVGLLVDPTGFPLEVHLFEGNTAETTTILPVLHRFQERHGITGMVVVADAGMLSANNLNEIEDAGFSFVVGSRITKAPYDLAEHFQAKGDYFTDGQILESTRAMGTRKKKRTRRVVYQYSFKRSKRDNKTINAQIAKAEKVAAGKAPLAKTRFLKVTDATKELNQATINRARQLAGLKGYVTNLDPAVMDGATVIATYHDLWQVEASFRMTKSDLKARPIFHHEREAIEAHLTIVLAALAVSRHLQQRTGMTIKKLVQTLRVARSATIAINGQRMTLAPEITDPVRDILDRLETGH